MSKANISNDASVTSRTRLINWSLGFIAAVVGFCALALAFASCVKAPEFSNIPKIEFVGLSKDTMRQGLNQQDSITVSFHFQDGDGDLGRMTESDENNVFVFDTRTGLLDNTFGIPFVPAQGSSNGIEGEVHIKLYSTCCIHPVGDPCTPSAQYPVDAVTYQIYITDRAGNSSNLIETPVIVLLCD
jgi:hypothetical protein